MRLDPPRSKLRWEELVNLSTVGDFDLLRNARQDIRQLKWADPMHREATRLYFNVERAKEELTRCNVEIQRLLTWMYDEHIDYQQAIARAKLSNPILARELSSRWAQQDRINMRLARRLKQTAELPGFTGELKLGIRIGRSQDQSTANTIPPPDWLKTLQVAVSDPEWVDIPDSEERDGDGDGDAMLAPDRTEEVTEIVNFLDRLEL